MRKTNITRKTKETTINLTLNLDGNQDITINTGIPFFDHMLTAFAYYAGIDLIIDAKGDTDVDDHHTVEDVGIVLGQALKETLKDKKGITRFASNFTPMDESLARTTLDISNRATLVYNAQFTRDTIGSLSLENIREFFYALAMNAAVTLHIDVLYGSNDHHKAEAIFKGVGRAINDAVQITSDTVRSTKGSL
ncbi:MAG: imidazoleglycerol-phosphate dehydratase HisB [Bacillota bacterium]